MRLKAGEIAEIAGGELCGNSEFVVTGAASLEDAAETDISFLANGKYLSAAAVSKAGLIIIPENITGIKEPFIISKNPQLAFAKILSLIEKEIKGAPYQGVHPTAVIGPGVTLGKEISIGPNAVIEENTVIGSSVSIGANSFVGRNSRVGHGCLIYPGVAIMDGTVIGANAAIHSGTVIGSDGFGYIFDGERHFKVPQTGHVEIGDDVEIGSNVSIDRATTGKTSIGKGTKIDNHVHIAHNVRIGSHCLLMACVGISGSVKIGDFVTIAGQAGISGHLKIGSGAIIAAKSGVTKNIPPKEVVSGFPAKRHRDELKKQAMIEKLPEIYKLVKERKFQDGKKAE